MNPSSICINEEFATLKYSVVDRVTNPITATSVFQGSQHQLIAAGPYIGADPVLELPSGISSNYKYCMLKIQAKGYWNFNYTTDNFILDWSLLAFGSAANSVGAVQNSIKINGQPVICTLSAEDTLYTQNIPETIDLSAITGVYGSNPAIYTPYFTATAGLTQKLGILITVTAILLKNGNYKN